MTEDYTLSPFDRRLVGRKNEYLIRHNRNHAQTAAEAILRREQPVWSAAHSDFRVGDALSRRSAALRAEPVALSQAKPAAAIAIQQGEVK